MMKMIPIPGKDYSIGQTTVTQGQWKKIMGTEPWKGQFYVQEGDDYPAVYVNWHDAVAFCKKLSEKEGKTYRLPTETEWEYACRGGTNTTYHFGDNPDDLSRYAWFGQNTWRAGEKSAQRVAKKISNQFELYDMHGNVWEWCSDLHGRNQESPALCGGSWYTDPDYCSAFCRIHYVPTNRSSDFGFRLARTLT